jgi:adenylosuccinate synthase
MSGSKRADVDYTFGVLEKFTQRLLPLAEDVGLRIHRAIIGGAAVLLEGAQGSLLDIDHGTYPYVTSSSTTSGGAATGVGIAPGELDSVIGVVKAYTTRVGNGPLPTEFDEPLASEIRQLGNEFGATTGRPRRCGWFDGVVVRYAARVNGLTDLAVTKLDVLDTLERIGLCTGYEAAGELYEEFPGDLDVLEHAVPRYEWFDGWKTSTAGARALTDLPSEARRYLDRIQSLVETQITYVSVGTRRDQIIASRVRATIAVQRRIKTQIAAELWGKSQQWFSLRINGHVPFTAGELIELANYLGVNVNEWQGDTDPTPGDGKPTVAYVSPYLQGMDGGGEKATAPKNGLLSLVRQVA